MRFAFFRFHLSKLLRLPRKSATGSYDMLHLSRKIISANLKTGGSKMQPLARNQRPHLLTALMNMSLVLHLPRKMHLSRSSSNVPRLPSFLEMLQNPHVLLTFDRVHNPLPLPRETTPEPPKVVRTCRVLNILTSKCASRHNGVHFFDISISKSGPSMVCFVHFDFEMCFAPQRRAIFHLSSGQLAPHRCFSEPTVRPSGATNHWKKTQCFATSLPFCAPASSFFWLFLSSDLLSSALLLSILLLHLCFSSVHIVGSLTSKLPSINFPP